MDVNSELRNHRAMGYMVVGIHMRALRLSNFFFLCCSYLSVSLSPTAVRGDLGNQSAQLDYGLEEHMPISAIGARAHFIGLALFAFWGV